MSSRIGCPVVTVAGTNGQGSTCAMLESIYRKAGSRTGLYTSPHLIRFNERFADALLVGFLAFGRLDGTLQNAQAVRVFQTTATA